MLLFICDIFNYSVIQGVITGKDQNNTWGNGIAELVFKMSFTKNEGLSINAHNLQWNQQAYITSDRNNKVMALNVGSVYQKESLKRD